MASTASEALREALQTAVADELQTIVADVAIKAKMKYVLLERGFAQQTHGPCIQEVDVSLLRRAARVCSDEAFSNLALAVTAFLWSLKKCGIEAMQVPACASRAGVLPSHPCMQCRNALRMRKRCKKSIRFSPL